MGEPTDGPSHAVTFREALRAWVRVALLSFGGPAGQIAVMHRILVDEKRWVSESRFLHALNYCMLLPGPEAQQLATYLGWLLHRTLGGIVAGVLFILPGFVSILALSYLYAGWGEVRWVEALFFGLTPAVMAVVVEAVFRIGRRALKNRAMVSLAAAAFVAIFFFETPFPAIILAAAAIGFLGGRVRPDLFVVIQPHTTADNDAALSDHAAAHTRPSVGRSLRVIALCGTLWFAPLIALIALYGMGNIFVQEGLFFSKAAVVTFGGAYAVLTYMAQQAVDVYRWLKPGEMLVGLGMAETTPGPLIQVVQFVGFLGAYRAAEEGQLGAMHPMLAGTLAAVWTTWVTFVPCFLWIFLGAPYIEHLRGNRNLSAALSVITAAVVGVILNLAVWFAIHTLFDTVDKTHAYGVRLLVPDVATLDAAKLAIAVGAFVALFVLKWSVIRTLAAAVAAGFAYYLVAGR